MSVKGYVNSVSIPEYRLDCQSRHSKSCVVNDGSLSTEVLRVTILPLVLVFSIYNKQQKPFGYRGVRSKLSRSS
jgi:hypothetical protein